MPAGIYSVLQNYRGKGKRKQTFNGNLETFNQKHDAIEFFITEENNKWLPYLALNIYKLNKSLLTEIFRKPITAINKLSNRPIEHKQIGHIELNGSSKQKELDIIINISNNNGYSTNRY